MKIKINNKNLEVKNVSCGLNGEEGFEYFDPTINLYTCLTHVCNTNCPFCEYHYKDTTLFDFDKWKYSVDKILEVIPIFKASFTGGEPTLKIEELYKCLAYLKSKNKNIFTIVNTNGSNLKLLDDLEYLDNIALSRHSISDLRNAQIFGNTVVPTLEELNNFKDKHKLHLSCNLMKDEIYNTETLLKYLEMASNVGIRDVGFVSLMPINEFAKNKGIDFSDLGLVYSNKFITNKSYMRKKENKCVCKCRNYLYLASNNNIITVYSRYYVDNSCNDSALVFIDNNLKSGFTGNVII